MVTASLFPARSWLPQYWRSRKIPLNKVLIIVIGFYVGRQGILQEFQEENSKDFGGLSQRFRGQVLQRRLFLEIWCGRDIPHKFWTGKRNSLRFIAQIQKLFWVSMSLVPISTLESEMSCVVDVPGQVLLKDLGIEVGATKGRPSGKIIDQFSSCLPQKP